MVDYQEEYRHNDDLIDQVVDWLAQRWTRTNIAFKLREILDKDIKSNTVKYIIKQAKERIVKRYHVPVEEFKGIHIAWLESVMRGRSFSKEGLPTKMCDRLRAGENLASLLNLENVSNDDPAEQAKQIHAFLRAAEATVGQDTDKDKSQDKQDKSQGDAASDNKPSTNEEQGDGKEKDGQESS